MALHSPLPHAFGRYILRERIAAGGMAEVFRAGQPGFGGFERSVAIKRMFSHLAEDPLFVEMVGDEAKIASQLTHPNIVSILDFGREKDDWFIAYELVDGVDLFRLLQRQFEIGRNLPIPLVIFVISELASALDFAHARKTADGKAMQIIHRDVSPQNVLVGYQGEVKLTDFGIAKATARATETTAGQVKGKVYYMSPEQARGEPLDHRSDLFSAGILLYELLCTRPLYEEGDHQQLLDAVGQALVKWPADKIRRIPPPLVALCERALSRQPDKRFQTGRELREALLQVADDLKARADREQFGTWVRRLFGVADDRPPMPQSQVARHNSAHWASIVAPVPTDPNDAPTASVAQPAGAVPTTPQRRSSVGNKVALPRSASKPTFEAPRDLAASALAAAAAFDDDGDSTSMIDTEAILRRLDAGPPPLPTVAAALPLSSPPSQAARVSPPPVPRPASQGLPPPVPRPAPPAPAPAAPQAPAPAPTLPLSMRPASAVAPRTLVEAPPGPLGKANAPAARSEASTRFVAAMADDDAPALAAVATNAASAPPPRPAPQPMFRRANEAPASWLLIALTVMVWSSVLVLGVYATLLVVR